MYYTAGKYSQHKDQGPIFTSRSIEFDFFFFLLWKSYRFQKLYSDCRLDDDDADDSENYISSVGKDTSNAITVESEMILELMVKVI